MKVLVTGAKGTLGADLVSLFSQKGYEVIATDREELDITNEENVMVYVEKLHPDVIINAAAYNLVDDAESPKGYELAFAINVLGPQYLARAAKKIGAKFVHYSSDYVFAGEKPEGYSEADERSPISSYGRTKAEGERFVEGVGGDFYIARTSKIFGKKGISENSKESFVHLMLRLAATKPELSIVNEEVGSPTYTKDIAEATLEMLSYPAGIYHLVNGGGGVTWYEFAQEIFELANVSIPVKAVPSSEFPKPATRPKFAALLNTKLPALPDRKDALKHFLEAEGLRM